MSCLYFILLNVMVYDFNSIMICVFLKNSFKYSGLLHRIHIYTYVCFFTILDAAFNDLQKLGSLP